MVEIQIQNRSYPVDIIKKKNKNTYFRINDDLHIVITTNYLATKLYIKKLIMENQEAIAKMILRKEEELLKKDRFLFLGEEYQIIYLSLCENVSMQDHRIYTKDQKMLDRYLIDYRKNLFQERLDFWYKKFKENIPYPKLRIRSMKTRWGVCNRKNNTVTLNAELLREIPDALDYVIVHELSHFVHFDHSKSFWETVGFYYPNYKNIRKALKE